MIVSQLWEIAYSLAGAPSPSFVPGDRPSEGRPSRNSRQAPTGQQGFRLFPNVRIRQHHRPARHHRQAGSHRLEHDVAEGLGQAGKSEDVGCRIVIRQRVRLEIAREVGDRAEPLLQDGPRRPIAYKEEADVGPLAATIASAADR